MKNINAALEYSNTDKISVFQPNDANSVLLKCFDELVVNARDAAENDDSCDTIKIN